MASSNNSSLKKNLPVSKSGSKVKIGIPSLCAYDDADDDEEEQQIINTNLKGKTQGPAPAPSNSDLKPRSGLFSILPPPKANQFTSAKAASSTASATKPSSTTKSTVTTTKSATPSFLIPRTVSNKMAASAAASEKSTPSTSSSHLPKKHKLDEDDGEEEYIEPSTSGASYFSMPGPSKMPMFSQYNDDEEEEQGYHDPDEDEEPQFERQQTPRGPQQQPPELDSDSLQKLIGGKRRLNEHIEIKDISARDIIGDTSIAMTKQITDDSKPSSNKDYFSANSKRKHQITYLAYVAKEREQELKNEWAQSKVNRMQSKMKYGF